MNDPDFQQWYAKYPRKKAPRDAYKAWIQTQLIRPPLTEMLAALDRAIASGEWTSDRKEFIPYPATYLRQWRWLDEYEVNLPTAAQIEQASKHWSETSSGIEEKGRELGIFERQYAHFPAFRAAVMAAAREH